MRNVILAVALVLLVAGAWFAGSPYLALDGLRTSMEEGDAAGLEDRVDFPRLRESLKAEFNARVIAATSESLADNPFGAVGLALASKMVDGIVDASVTPSGLARLASGEAAPQPQAPNDRAPSSGQAGGAFEDARIERETASRFSVWVPSDSGGGEVRFVFRRRGLSWVLTSIELPEIEAE
jgi:hypothetical protein